MKLSRALSIRFALPLALGLLSGPAVLRLSAQDCPDQKANEKKADEKKADEKKDEKPDPACEAIDTDGEASSEPSGGARVGLVDASGPPKALAPGAGRAHARCSLETL